MDGALTVKSPGDEQDSENSEFKTLNKKICSEAIEYSSMSFNSSNCKLALFEADSCDRIDIFIRN